MDLRRIVAVIMAGGEGTRFWPRSRKVLPKQYLSFDGTTSLLRQTVDRLKGFVPPEQTFIITGEEHTALAQEHSGLPPSSILGEPRGRDTAACIGLGAVVAKRLRPDAVMLVLSADHLIHPVEPFRAALLRAATLAGSSRALVTIGLRPDRPATGYGYIEIGDRVDGESPEAHRVLSFREKPELESARRFVLGGNFLWNAGMFAFGADAVLDALREFVPAVYEPLAGLRNPRDRTELAAVYQVLPKISIDYGVLERAPDRLVVEAGFEWDDLGTFEAVARHARRVGENNLARGEAAFVGASGCLVDNDADGLVVVSGLADVLVVRTRDAVIVLPRGEAERVKDVVRELGRQGHGRYL